MSIKGFMQNGALEKYDYNSLENLPTNLGGGYVDENNIIVLGGIPSDSINLTKEQVQEVVSTAMGDAVVSVEELRELDEVIG